MAERRSAADTDAGAAEDKRRLSAAKAGREAEDKRRLSAAKAGGEGARQIAELTGKAPEGVSGVQPSDDGWRVTVEVVEDRRIPSSTDLLATYEVELAPDGELVSYRRVRRYARGRGDSDGSA